MAMSGGPYVPVDSASGTVGMPWQARQLPLVRLNAMSLPVSSFLGVGGSQPGLP